MQDLLWPNLFLVGAPRCGTTALYEYLRQHPEVLMSPAKEPGFLAVEGPPFDLEHRHRRTESYFVTTIDDYRALFRHWRGEPVRGEATPHYLHHPLAPERIRHYAPDARVVVLLRSPAARAFSSYMQAVRDQGERRSFDAALLEGLRADAIPPMIGASLYSQALRRYRESIDAARVLVLLSEEFAAATAATLRCVFDFLEVDPDFAPELAAPPNRSGRPRWPLVHRLVQGGLDHRLMRRVHRSGPRGLGSWLEGWRARYYRHGLEHRNLPRETETFLNRSVFGTDIRQTEEVLDRDLSTWTR